MLIRSRGEYAEQNAGVNTKTAGMKEIAGMTTSFQMPLQSTPFLWSDVKNAWRMGAASQSAFSYMQELRIRTAVLENGKKVMEMAEYHVGCGAFGIYAGTLNSRNKSLWKNKTECTDEALCAVRDYMVQELLGGIGCEKATSSGYEWTLKDGRFVELRVTIKDGARNG